MVGISCAVESCWGSKASKHRFPNPSKDLNLFLKWVQLCRNNRLLGTMTPEKVFTNCRVCKIHFREEDFAANNRLKPCAFPSKFLTAEDLVCSIPQTLPKIGNVVQSISQTSGISIGKDPGMKSVLQEICIPSTSESGEHLHLPLVDMPVTPTKVTPRKNILLSMGITRSSQLTPRKKHLYKQLNSYKRIAYNSKKSKKCLKERLVEATKFSKENNFEKLVEDLTPIQKRFFECKLRNCKKTAKGRRYSSDDKILALALLKQMGGSAYKYLSYIFILPSKETITKFLNKMHIKPGSNDIIFKAEADFFNHQQDKYCILLFDEMSVATQLNYNKKEDCIEGFDTLDSNVNEFANHAQVFMVCGIRKKWKQPILFNFLAGTAKSIELAQTVKLLIRKLKESGLIVCAVVCDQGSNNSAALNYLVKETRGNKLRRGEEMDISEFYFEIDDQKIIPIFDPPHLLKCIRNNLIKYDLIYFVKGSNLLPNGNM